MNQGDHCEDAKMEQLLDRASRGNWQAAKFLVHYQAMKIYSSDDEKFKDGQ